MKMSHTALWFDAPVDADNGAAFTSFTESDAQSDQSHMIWKTKGLPIGNGHMGAMLLSGVKYERLQLNEKTLWEGKPNHIEADKSPYFRRSRAFMFAGDTENAYKTLTENCEGTQENYGTYTPFGNVIVDFTDLSENAACENYRRYLDLEHAVYTSTFTVDGVTYTRECFASYPNRLIVLRVKTDKPQHTDICFHFTNKPNVSKELQTFFANNILHTSGKLADNGLRYAGAFAFAAEGGSITYENGAVSVKGANAVTVTMTMATDYAFDESKDFRNGYDPSALVCGILANAADQDFDALLCAHLADYKELFDNASLNLFASNDIPTDRMRANFIAGKDNLFLDELFFQYGRYLMIASSRDGSLPANLQGVWADQKHPCWESDYHININLQMNYYPAANTNLIACMTPLLDWCEQTALIGKKTARNVYGCGGWVSHTCNNAYGFTDPGWGDWGIAPESGAWLCLNLWDIYDYTRDTTHLPRIYMVMQEAVRFYTDYMIIDPKTGEYVSGPSYSPENGPMTMGVKITQQLVKELYQTYLTASALDFTPTADCQKGELVETVKEQLSKLQTPVEIGCWGNIKEWRDYQGFALEEGSKHRHISHLLCLHPCSQITRRTPELLRAARTTLNSRGDESTGWSRALKALFWARAIGADDDANLTERGSRYVKHVSNGDRAYNIYRGQLGEMVFDNLFDFHQGGDRLVEDGIFQIDGNFGSTAALGELLLQSHDGYLDILPALPTAWSKKGEVKGLLGRGGFAVDVTWENGKPTGASVKAMSENVCKLYQNDAFPITGICCDGKEVTWEQMEEDGLTLLAFSAEKGKTYTLTYA